MYTNGSIEHPNDLLDAISNFIGKEALRAIVEIVYNIIDE
jgi:hypothetical protein